MSETLGLVKTAIAALAAKAKIKFLVLLIRRETK
tara:strand:- start:911 stop:1012 length:102 start_codon:yes stop_codon:yes gene_type:complete